jgi:hypothetical protein
MTSMAASKPWKSDHSQFKLERGAVKAGARDRCANRWWQTIDTDCPISLAPINELQQPPFALEANGSNIPHYFDARVLASFLITSGDFINPMNRAPLTHDECADLDAHLRRYYHCDAVASVADAFDLFKMRDLNCRAGADQVQREETAVLQHLFQFRSRRAGSGRHGARSTDNALTADTVLASTAPPSMIGEAFPALPTTSPPTRSPMPKRRATASHQTRRRLPLHTPVRSSSGSPSDPDALRIAHHESDQVTVDAESSWLLAEAEAEVETEVATVASQRASTRGRISSVISNKWEPQFLNPLPTDDSSSNISTWDDGDQETLIAEELEVLRSIYGDDGISWTRSQDNNQRPCWQIHVVKLPWHLHLLIPSDLPYPYACPLVCPQLEDRCVTVEQVERLVSELGATAKCHLGEAFIFDLIERLSNSY